ncbi:MAG: peptide chain release factor N(5)-glutamine methyltransferase [Heliobacteriaceae bacterium]|nr:peptide chain release factor N(5)-glutamine methyltransferase [Heliobacteriaceae bacterium]
MTEGMGPATVGETLRVTAFFFRQMNVASSRLEAEVLLAHVMGITRTGLLTRLDEPVPAEVLARITDLVARRVAGWPLQYLTEKQEFWGLDFYVNPAVLIPRPETEVLVAETLSILRRSSLTLATPLPREEKVDRTVWLADVGTGSGAVAVALAKEMTNVCVVATDLAPQALNIARRNALAHAVDENIVFVLGDLLEPVINRGLRLQAVVANPPYIPSAEMPGLQREVQFEPWTALDGGDDGLSVYRRLVPQAARVLVPGGHLVLEIDYRQGTPATMLLEESGFTGIRVVKDFQGHDRVVTGKLPKSG